MQVSSSLLLAGLLGLTLVSHASGQGTPSNPGWDTFADTWVATDALGRTTPAVSVTGPRDPSKTLSLFYYIWNGSHSKGLYDITQIITQDPTAIHDFDNPLWGPLHNWHHWGEPLFGYYFMHDEWVIRRHAQMLTDAGVDVIFFDVTNAITYKAVYDTLFDVYQDLLAAGQDVPKIAFMTHSKSGETVQKLYDDIYALNRHSNLWFHWNGKPLILGTASDMSVELKSYFTVRGSWAWRPGEDEWGWLEREPQQGGWHGSPDNLEQVPVSPGSHPHIDGGGNGKSYHRGSQPLPADYNSDLGIKFNNQWRRALELDPPVVLMSQWNEWTAQRFKYSGGTTTYAKRPLYDGDPWFIDVYDKEYNRDLEPMKGGYGDNYYYQLIDNSRRFQGAGLVDNASAPNTINITDFSTWDGVGPEYRDDQDDVRHRDHRGFGTTHYTNTTGRNDLKRALVARDETHLYLYAETVGNISSKSSGDEFWMNCFLRDETSAAPAWENFHYRLANLSPASDQLTLQRSNGGWNWTTLGTVPTHTNGNQLAVSIPRSLLGLPDSSSFVHFSFKWSDNQQGTTAEAWLLNGDAAPNARFRYPYWAGGSHTSNPASGKSYRLINRATLKVAAPDGSPVIAETGYHIEPNDTSISQKFTFLVNGSGRWQIFPTQAAIENGPANRIALEIPNAASTDGLAVRNAVWTGSDHQLWTLSQQNDGWFRILNVATGKALARDANGAIVQIASTSGEAELWSLEPVAPVDSGGLYQFYNRKSGLLANLADNGMRPGNPIIQSSPVNDWNEQWVTYVHSPHRVQIVSEESRRPLQSSGLSTAVNAAIVQGAWSANEAQLWDISMTAPGYFQFVNAASGHVIGVQNDSLTPTTPLVQRLKSGNIPASQWSFSAIPTNIPLITNPNFDPPDENTADNPWPGSGPISAWTRSTNTIGVNNSALPFLNGQAAHSGTHVAYIQGSGNISQALMGYDPTKLYTVTYFVGERGTAGVATSTSVSLNGGATSYSQPGNILKTDKFRRIVSGPLAVSGSTSTLQIRAAAVTGDTTLLIDTVSLSRAVPNVPDGGFENPVQPGTAASGYKEAAGGGSGTLVGTLWNFSGVCGITRNGSSFSSGVADHAPEGSQAALLRSTGGCNTTVTGFESGVTYSLSFAAKGRGSTLGPNIIQVRLGGEILTFSENPSVTPGQSAWATFTTDPFVTAGGDLELQFTGLTGGDKTSFVDDIRFDFVSEVVGNEAPVFDADPLVMADAAVESPYTDTLADHLTDADGDPVVFAKLSGPAWLNVAQNGTLSGTPAESDIGLSSFTVSASDGIAPPVEATMNLTVLAASGDLTFAEYISNSTFGLDLSEQGFSDDPDGDGIANGLEAWFGTHPGEFSKGLANVARNGNTITFTHSRNENAPTDISGYYEWSPNLVDWYPGDGTAGPDGGPTVTITSESTETTTTTVTATSSAPIGRTFLRAGVRRE